MESSYQKIIRKNGWKAVECKCSKCQNQCRAAPCLGTPKDIKRIIYVGYADKLMMTEWYVEVALGVMNHPIKMDQTEQTGSSCIFFQNGLCELHASGLKPPEGKLSHHSMANDQRLRSYKKIVAYNVAKEWENIDNAELIM